MGTVTRRSCTSSIMSFNAESAMERVMGVPRSFEKATTRVKAPSSWRMLALAFVAMRESTRGSMIIFS